MSNVAEVDIWYLTGQRRETIRFFDRRNKLTRMKAALEKLRKDERKMYQTPPPSGLFHHFAIMWRNRLAERVTHLQQELNDKTEHTLRIELKSFREITTLIHGEQGKDEFRPLDGSGRHEILEILDDYHRWFEEDYVSLGDVRIIAPKRKPALVLVEA